MTQTQKGENYRTASREVALSPGGPTVLSLAFLGGLAILALLVSGSSPFLVNLLTFLAKGYLPLYLATLGGLMVACLVVGYVFLPVAGKVSGRPIPAPKDYYECAGRRVFFFVSATMAVTVLYFSLKALAVGQARYMTFPYDLESSLWQVLIPALSSLPDFVFTFLDTIYVDVWMTLLKIIPAILILPFPRPVIRLNACLVATLSVVGVLNYFLPARSPIYAFDLSYLPKGLASLDVHGLSQRVNDTLLSGAFPGDLSPYGFQPISCFPSFHVAYCSLIVMTVRDFVPYKPVQMATGVFFALVSVGSIVLGYHYIVDDIAGVVLAAIIYKLAVKTEGRFGTSGEE